MSNYRRNQSVNRFKAYSDGYYNTFKSGLIKIIQDIFFNED